MYRLITVYGCSCSHADAMSGLILMIVETLPRLWRVGFAVGLGASGLLPKDHTALGVPPSSGFQADMCIKPSYFRILRW